MIKKTLDILKEALDNHYTIRDLTLKSSILTKARLQGLRADGIDFGEADLRQSALTAVKWKGCSLRDARLDAADFTDAVLRVCDLDQARAIDAVFIRTRLENSTARGTRFDRADLTEAVLTDTDFSRASLCDAKLEGVSASGADFRGADLRGANLKNADLVDTDLCGADLTGADLRGADLRGADLRGVVGDDPALQGRENQGVELPEEMKALSETVTPIVIEVLRSAGKRGVMDPSTADRLIKDAAKHYGTKPGNEPNPETLRIVSRMLYDLGDDVVPRLLGALRQSNQKEPPSEIKDMIRRLKEAFSLDEAASVEDVLSRLVEGLGVIQRRTDLP